RIRRRRRRRRCGIINRRLRENRRDVGTGLTVALEPSVHLALGVGAVSRLRTRVHPHREDARECLRGGALRHQRFTPTRLNLSAVLDSTAVTALPSPNTIRNSRKPPTGVNDTTLSVGAYSTPSSPSTKPRATSVASIARASDCVLGGKVGIATALTVACQLPGSPFLRWVGARHLGAQCEPFVDD